MKKVIKALCSVFCIMSINLPVTALADPLEEREESGPLEEQSLCVEDGDDYAFIYLRSDFGESEGSAIRARRAGNLLLYICSPDGRLVRDAQVVTSVSDGLSLRQMTRARPMLGGYLLPVSHLPTGRYHVETEIVSDGWLLTDEFDFSNA